MRKTGPRFCSVLLIACSQALGGCSSFERDYSDLATYYERKPRTILGRSSTLSWRRSSWSCSYARRLMGTLEGTALSSKRGKLRRPIRTVNVGVDDPGNCELPSR